MNCHQSRVLTTVAIQFSENTIAAGCMYLSLSGFKLIPYEKYMPVLLATSKVKEEEIIRILSGYKFTPRMCRVYEEVVSSL